MTVWTLLLDLAARARRPIVFVDFETSDLGGAPPVEFAVLRYAPWEAPEQDPVTVRARQLAPPGLTYAASMRLNPRRPIAAGAFSKHRISADDVAQAIPYDDLGIRATFREIADGLPPGRPGGPVGPAVWVGHNVAGADAPWALGWGYLPSYPADDALIDTMRLFQRLSAEHPRPLAVDLIAVDEEGGFRWTTSPGEERAARPCPAIGYGLDVFKATLEACHLALVGTRPEASHGALPDCISSARVLALELELWAPLWPFPRADQLSPPAQPRPDQDPAVALANLVRALGAPPPGFISWDGWLRPDGAGGFTFAKGNRTGEPAGPDDWVCSLPRHPTGVDRRAWCSEATARVLGGQRRFGGM